MIFPLQLLLKAILREDILVETALIRQKSAHLNPKWTLLARRKGKKYKRNF